MIAVQYDNGNGGTNVLVGFDDSDDGNYMDLYVVIENVGVADISKSDFDFV
ncbi:hypothetical protein [Devosia pacifica]|uniref:hypothetical protein n=1 Tax=Devosia pacifica TaxID=1335967 RepID=UPI00188D2FBF|nr:hypothetical protein [Devosia pacifica]